MSFKYRSVPQLVLSRRVVINQSRLITISSIKLQATNRPDAGPTISEVAKRQGGNYKGLTR